MLGNKGQTEAPFQLLIAAVMLSMLLPIAFYLFQQYQIWESQERVRNNMETLARELETVANLGEGQKYITVDLSVYGGPNFRVDHFELVHPSSSDCMMACHTPNCWELRAIANNYTAKHESPILVQGLGYVCIRVPFNVDFQTTGCGYGYEDLAVDSIQPGIHQIVAIKKGYTVHLCAPKQVSQ